LLHIHFVGFILKTKFKWSTIPPISTKQTIASHLKSLNTTRLQQHVMLECKLN